MYMYLRFVSSESGCVLTAHIVRFVSSESNCVLTAQVLYMHYRLHIKGILDNHALLYCMHEHYYTPLLKRVHYNLTPLTKHKGVRFTMLASFYTLHPLPSLS